ncbi:MAG: molybdenum ABC transporter ATP-binding protein [Pseudomonadota bacterium]
MSGGIDFTARLGTFDLRFAAQAEPGITAIFGPSGAGKTSVLRIIAGLETPTVGRIEIGGRVWFDSRATINLPPAERRAGYVFQEPRLFPHLSVAANLRYGQRPGAATFDAIAALLGLEGLLARHPRGLSGGEAQRVALGRALLTNPGILLMDEPLSALDIGLKREILPYLERLSAKASAPVFYVSHDIDEVARLADRIVLMEAGQAEPAQSVARALAQAEPGLRVARDIAGGLLQVEIVAHHPEDGLTEARLGNDALWLPGRVSMPGQRAQLRVDARDVTLARSRPNDLSALNILPATITKVHAGPGAGALVRLETYGQEIAAKLTARSVRQLGLASGQSVHAILKTMAVTPDRVTGL